MTVHVVSFRRLTLMLMPLPDVAADNCCARLLIVFIGNCCDDNRISNDYSIELRHTELQPGSWRRCGGRSEVCSDRTNDSDNRIEGLACQTCALRQDEALAADARLPGLKWK
jgi:hypothetical protein